MAKNTTIIKARYDATHMKPYYFKFHIVNDADIIDKLSKVDSRQDYIRQLIREDLARTRPGSVPDSVPDSVPENSTPVPEKACSVPVLTRKKHPSTKDLLKALEPYIPNYGDSMYDLVNALAADIMGYDIDS